MSLPQPNLDDRRFQDLVDEAKRMVQQRCPEWTDHNVSDPGVTLIETFAHMVDQLIYRLNRVPDKNHLAFLDLIGVRLFPPAAARTELTFWLSAPQPQPVQIRAGVEVATLRTETEEAVVFSTDRQLDIVNCELAHLAVVSAGLATDRDAELAEGRGTPCFSAVPQPGDALLFGLSRPVPHCAVALRLDVPVQGHGINPDHPPLAWEAWTDGGWAPCEVERDTTGGFNRPGDVILHVPGGHTASAEARHRAAWLRCRIAEPTAGRRPYSSTPVLISATAFTVGGTTTAVHAELVRQELLGHSEGVPGQTFTLARPPVVAGGEPVVIEIDAPGGRGAPGVPGGRGGPSGPDRPDRPDGPQEWHTVDGFGESAAQDRHVHLDRATGELSFGPAIRQPDGTLREFGAVPAKGAAIRVRAYRTGGGRIGNVARGALTVLRSSIPYVARVENRQPAAGGVDGEDVANARLRGGLELRTRGRAVTAEDYEALAREAAPELARVRCVATETGPDAGGVRVLLVPNAPDDGRGRLDFARLACTDELYARVVGHLDARRMLGTRLLVEPPYYQGVTVVAELRPRPPHSRVELQQEALTALYRYFNPLTGGPDGTGWPFGRPVQSGEVYAVLQRLPGVELVERVRLFPADPRTGQRGEAVDRIQLAAHALVFSYEHQVRVA
ncbi:putative baseplate assembly protein [Kitasatospora sp. NPDC097643]|uniref:putative baseplate assembly protein n=1 Tax=Kitasatospora sp. NPDC097643 TaxID=3157230 RepID=UPI003331B8A3